MAYVHTIRYAVGRVMLTESSCARVSKSRHCVHYVGFDCLWEDDYFISRRVIVWWCDAGLWRGNVVTSYYQVCWHTARARTLVLLSRRWQSRCGGKGGGVHRFHPARLTITTITQQTTRSFTTRSLCCHSFSESRFALFRLRVCPAKCACAITNIIFTHNRYDILRSILDIIFY